MSNNVAFHDNLSFRVVAEAGSTSTTFLARQSQNESIETSILMLSDIVRGLAPHRRGDPPSNSILAIACLPTEDRHTRRR